MISNVRKFILLALALTGLTFIWSCINDQTDGDQYITWSLNPSLKDYDTVSIKLVLTSDNSLLETVHYGKLEDPEHFPKYKLHEAKGKDFTIQIRCMNAKGDVLLSKDLKVVGAKPEVPVTLTSDVRIFDLSVTPGKLDPDFSPAGNTFRATVDEAVASVTLSAIPYDLNNVLTVDAQVADWATAVKKDLHAGSNPIVVTSSTKDGKATRSYTLLIWRGKEIAPESVTGVTVKDSALTLYTGDAATADPAVTEPLGAMQDWTSENPNVATVDAAGNIKPIGPGDVRIIVKAGNMYDTVNVKVKTDAPTLDVGPNKGIKPGEEVVFTIALNQEHGTYVSFKYDLDGDSAWDNLADTTTIPASLKHTYPTVGKFTARFEVKDSEGNRTPASRVITVDDKALQVVILSPPPDTTVKTLSILVVYTVNGTKLEKAYELAVEGANKISVDTVNGADKGSANVTVYRDTKAPGAPTVTGPATTADLKPTWSWTTGGGGIGIFRYASDSAGLNVATPGSAVKYTPAANLIPGDHWLYVQERDSVGNWSEPGKAKVSIKAADTTGPNPPHPNGTSPTNQAPEWSWISGGNGGAGIYKYKLEDSTLAGATESNATTYKLTDAPVAGKKYTLWVAERDSAGNWSKAAGWAVTFDNTKPTVSILLPQASGVYITSKTPIAMSGTATAPGTGTIVKVAYKINNQPAADCDFTKPNWSIPGIALIDGQPTLIGVVATDNLGNTGEATLTLTRDASNPNQPIISTSPATPTKANKGGWAWGPGTDNTNGSGLNGKYRYGFDGVNWTETSALLVSNLDLIQGTNTFQLQEQDQALNWSASATKTVVADFSGPALAITSPAANATLTSIHVTATGTVSDSLTSVASVVVTGQESGATTTTILNGGWSTGDLVMRNSGLDTLTITATDAVGNVTVKTVVVTINVALPQLDISYPIEGTPYNKDTITVQYKVNNGALQKQLFTKAATDPDGNWALQVESTPNEAGQTNKKTVTILRDKTGPSFPTLSPSGTNWTKALPSWTFTSGGDGAGGGVANAWEYSYTYNGGAAVTGALTTNSFSLLAAAEGTYAFNVRQQDKAGNWGPYSSISTLKYDKTAPAMSVNSPASGLITNAAAILLSCKVGNTNLPGKNVNLIEGANTLYCDSTDSAGNLGRATATVYSAPRALFVDAKAPYGGDGSTWGKAFYTIQDAMAYWVSNGGLAGNKEIWVAAGTYTSPSNDTGYYVKSGMKFYGGFPANGSAYNISQRTFAAADTSNLESGRSNIFSLLGTSASSKVSNVLIDGFKVHYSDATYAGSAFSMSNATGITVQRCNISHNLGTGSAMYAYNASYTFDQCKFNGHGFEGSMLYSSGGGAALFSNCDFSGNSYAAASYKVLLDFDSMTSVSFTNSLFLDPLPQTDNHYIRYAGTGSLSITGSTFAATQARSWDIPVGLAGTRSGNTFAP